jgi:hypothetical protein
MTVLENFFEVKDDTYSITRIQKLPNTLNNIHESCYKSYHVMNLMVEMLERGDSAESILMLVKHFGSEQHTDETVKIPTVN